MSGLEVLVALTIAVGLVVDVGRDLAQLVAVLAGVVCTEEELAATLQGHPKVCLRAAAIAAVDRGQRGCARGCRSGHVGLSLWSRFLVQRRAGEEVPKILFCSPAVTGVNIQSRLILPA